MSASMRAVTWTGPSRLEQVRRPRPLLAGDRVLLRPTHVGICGSDLAILRGEHARARPGIVLGHEFGGVVVDAGRPGADGLEAGTRVAVRPLIACADRGEPLCPACASGMEHVCARLGLYGVDEPGALAEEVSVRRSALVAVAPDSLPHFVALAEPLAVAVHAVARAGRTLGDVVVFGGGPIGLLCALVARHGGASFVVVVEPNPARAAVAARYGLAVVEPDQDPVAAVMEATGGRGADVVFDSAGHPAVTPLLTQTARIGGTIVVVGVYKQPPPVDLRTVNFAEQTLVGTRVYTRAAFADAVTLLDGDTLGLAALPIESYPLDQAEGAFAAAARGTSMKVFLTPATSEPTGTSR